MTATADALDLTREQVEALDAARDLARAGVPVFVAPPNPHHGRTLPDGALDRREFLLPSGWEATTADPAALDAWRPGWAVCIVTGHGVDAADIDPKNGASVAEQRDRLAALGVEVLAVVITPSDGAHFYVRSAGICSTSAPAVGVDYRGRGLDGTGSGFLYAPGTSRPRYDGAGYVWAEPFDPEDLADLARDDEQADAVAAYLAGLGVTVRTRREHAPAAEVGGEPLPERLPEWLVTEVEDLGPTWQAGPKDDRRTSADRSERFYRLVAMARRARLTQGQAVTLLDPWAHAVGKYVGRVAAEVARAWPKVEPEQPDGSTLPEGPSTARVVVLDPEDPDASAFPDAEPWEDPLPLGTPTAPTLPLDGLPDYLRAMVEAVTEQSQAPREVVLAAALGTLAAATRGAWDVHVRPGWNAGPTCAWFLTLAPSGERKDAGTAPLVEPLTAAEKTAAADVRRANRSREAERKRLAAALKAAEAEDDPTKIDRLTEELWAARARPVPALVLSDTTTEAAGLHMAEQGGALAIFGTEANALHTVAGRYSDAGGNFGLLNRAYDGATYTDARVKRESIHVHRPVLTWAVAVQPEVVAGYANADAEGSGFLARFCLLMPESRVGRRNLRSAPVPEPVAAAWRQVVGRLYSAGWVRYSAMCEGLPDDLGDPGRLALDPEAAELIVTYAERLEAENTPGSVLRSLGGWTAKHPARMARLAAVLALADDPHRATVTAEHVTAALTLADALVSHAAGALDSLRSNGAGSPAERVRQVLRHMGQAEVSTREVFKAVQGQAWAGSTDVVRAALDVLADLGYVRGPAKVTSPKGGKPSERWQVWPGLLTE